MEFFAYLLKVSACSALFFAFYLLVLRKLTFFKINRFYLLASLLISFIIPALQFTIERELQETIVVSEPTVRSGIDEVTLTRFQTPITLNSPPAIKNIKQFNWLSLLPSVYIFVVASLLLVAARRIIELLKHTKSGVKEINGLKLVAKEQGFTNCSFFNYVFIDENSLTEGELQVLLKHEEVHAKQYHSVDKLALMIAKAVLWFNPIVYLFDKALEETHEYEADDTTSKSIGTETYASLLLKLAVSKSSVPLLHNFVKSPIKQRIKMLFNSKSTNMKKLAYLFALPIGLGLMWGFTVKVTHRIKPLTVQDSFQLKDTLIGKTVKGKVIGFETLKLGEFLNLQVGSTILPVSSYRFKNKVKIGDEITVSISGNALAPPPIGSTININGIKSVGNEKPTYMVSKVIGPTGKLIYETPRYAFLYEANRARFAWSTIKSIEKDANGVINKIVLFNNEFTINLNVAAQHFKSNDFKKGDSVEVKFIGEKLTGAKTYTTDKLIALYSCPRKYRLINKAIYPKFYDENGRQKVYDRSGKLLVDHDDLNLAKVAPKARLLSSSNLMIDNRKETVFIKDAVIEISNGILSAKEVETDLDWKTIRAKNAKFVDSKGAITTSELMTFDQPLGTFSNDKGGNTKAYDLLVNLNLSNPETAKASSTKGNSMFLTGKIKLDIENYSLTAKAAFATKGSDIITLVMGSVHVGTKNLLVANRIEFNISTKQAYVVEGTNTASAHTQKTNFRSPNQGSLANLKYAAEDSTIVSKKDQVFKLYGNAKVTSDEYTLTGKRIDVNSKNKIATIYDGLIAQQNGAQLKAKRIEFDLLNKQAIMDGKIQQEFMQKFIPQNRN